MAKTPRPTSRIDTRTEARAIADSLLADLRTPRVRQCRICKCTQGNCTQCIQKTGAPCFWVQPDLCSACAPAALPSFRQKVADLAPRKVSRLGPMKPTDLVEILKGLEGKAGRAKKAWAFSEVIHEPVISGVDQAEDGSPVVRRKAGPIVQATMVMILEVPTVPARPRKKGKRS